MVTGLVTAAVQVAVTCVAGEAERWTDGSLAVQLEFLGVAIASHTLPAPNRSVAVKIWLFPGAAAA